MSGNVIDITSRIKRRWDEDRVPTICAYGPFGSAERKRLLGLFKGYDRISMRYFWDRIGDDSFYHGLEGDFDCADIHGYMNMIGDGDYCAV